MTVQELIEELKKLPPDAIVYRHVEADDYYVDLDYEIQEAEYTYPYCSGDRSSNTTREPGVVLM